MRTAGHLDAPSFGACYHGPWPSCEPSPEGDGLCGRLAPHALIGRSQAAIAAQEAARGEKALRLRQASPQRPPGARARPEGRLRGA